VGAGPAMTIDIGARFDPDVLVDDVARHMRRAGQHDFLGFDLAFNGTGQFDRLAIDRTLDLGARPDRDGDAVNVAIHFTIDADIFGAFQLAGDAQGLADHGDADGFRRFTCADRL